MEQYTQELTDCQTKLADGLLQHVYHGIRAAGISEAREAVEVLDCTKNGAMRIKSAILEFLFCAGASEYCSDVTTAINIGRALIPQNHNKVSAAHILENCWNIIF